MGSPELWARIDGGGTFPTGGPAAWHERRRGAYTGCQAEGFEDGGVLLATRGAARGS